MRGRTLLTLAWRSAGSRRFSLGLVVLCIALSSFLLLAVERLRLEARESFVRGVSGTDLIVGPRTGSVQLLLSTVFHAGQVPHTMRPASAEALAADPAVAWVLPIALGDSYRGFPVVASTPAYFQHVRQGDGRALVLADGRPYAQAFDVVLGAEVAARTGHRLGDRLVLSHGDGQLDQNDHANLPFTVVGILARSGTPSDRALLIDLAGMQALHLEGVAGMPPLGGRRMTPEQALAQDLRPRSLNALRVGLKSRSAVFSVQRRVGAYAAEPLMAILPGVALDELWEVVGAGEQALRLMGALVAVVSLAGLVAVVVGTLAQRLRELAVLRSLGAGPRWVLLLLGLEGLLLSAAGALLGSLGWLLVQALAGSWLQAQHGVSLGPALMTPEELQVLGGVLAAGLLASLLPGWRAYRLSMAQGLNPPA